VALSDGAGEPVGYIGNGPGGAGNAFIQGYGTFEGNNDNSDTWFAENVTPTVFKEPSGKAVNNYELWAEDIDLARGLGLNAYRFSGGGAPVEQDEGTFPDKEPDDQQPIVAASDEHGVASEVTRAHLRAPTQCAKAFSRLLARLTASGLIETPG